MRWVSFGSGVEASVLQRNPSDPADRPADLHFWTLDEDDERASVGALSFSSDIHENLTASIAGD